MTVYSSDGEVYDTPLHHELGMSQADLKPPEEGPVRVAGKKSYEPPPIKKPPTLPPLEPLTDPGNPPRGQYGPPGIEYPPWTVERPFAMNDNTPPLPLDITMPNIAGGLSKPPKPANDNDPRKPLHMSENLGYFDSFSSMGNAWGTYYGETKSLKNVDKDLEDGPIMVPKSHKEIDKYLKNNPDLDYYE